MKKNKPSKAEEEKIFVQAMEEYPLDLATAKRFFKLSVDKSTGDFKTSEDGKYKIEGKQLVIRMQAKDAHSPTLLRWIESQENFSDALRYLIEQEILLNGVRNLGKYIPQVRDLEGALREQQLQYQEEILKKTDVVYTPTSPISKKEEPLKQKSPEAVLAHSEVASSIISLGQDKEESVVDRAKLVEENTSVIEESKPVKVLVSEEFKEEAVLGKDETKKPEENEEPEEVVEVQEDDEGDGW